MLYIGGTRDGQRANIPFNGNRIRLPIEPERQIIDFLENLEQGKINIK